MSRRVVICIALRRSGTTLIWRTFRQLLHLYCLDEPFNPFLYALPRENAKQVCGEFIVKYLENPEEFRSRFAPIAPCCEPDPRLTDAQAAYLQWLIEGHDCVFTDITRCHFKLESLYSALPEATIVHLYRSPENFASSHLLPRRSGTRVQDRLHNLRDRSDFFTRRDRLGGWGMGEILDVAPYSQLRERFKSLGIDERAYDNLPAFAKLMAYWWIAYREVDKTGARLYGEHFISVPFSRFCQQPQEVVDQVLATAGVPGGKIDSSAIHSESPPYQPEHAHWREWRERLGIPEHLSWRTS